MRTSMAQRVVGSRARWAAALAALAGSSTLLASADAQACGGFFCGQQPVDQTAERILFEVGQDSVSMTTQISFNGKAADFAWILPLGEVPPVESLAVYPQGALNALDSNSGPQFQLPQDSACYQAIPLLAPSSQAAPTSGGDSAPPPVTVYVRAEVGPYDAVVVGSTDPNELVMWLRTEGYRITPVMEPYVARYTEEGMKFLALKLKDTADIKDLAPFRFSLPGTAPSIPLRMTALAAEPEMSIVVFVLGQRRFEGKNWANVEIADDQILFNPFNYSFNGLATNWAQLVAQGVDKNNGQGWVTEFAGPSDSYEALVRSQVQNDNFRNDDDRAAARALLGSLEAYPYLTRLYTRVSAEEMTSDPIFGQSSQGDIDRLRQLSRIVNGVDQCAMDGRMSTDPCDFATCGAAGLCRPIAANATGMAPEPALNGTNTPVAGCACWAGATARLTAAPDGSTAVVCQDGRLSFLNPGDREAEGLDVLPDPCAGFSCGANGQCISMNLTPTCVCDQGYVAVGQMSNEGVRTMNCVAPKEVVPAAFYASRLPALPDTLPGGREVVLTEPEPIPAPGATPEPVETGGFPMPRANPDLGPSQIPVAQKRGDGGCTIAAGTSTPTWGWLLALGAAARLRRRRS